MEKVEPPTNLEQLEDSSLVVWVLNIHLGPGRAEEVVEGEVAGVDPVAAEDEEGAKDRKEDGEDGVEAVEPHVDWEEGACLPQSVLLLLRKIRVTGHRDLGVTLLRTVVRNQLGFLIILGGITILSSIHLEVLSCGRLGRNCSKSGVAIFMLQQ